MSPTLPHGIRRAFRLARRRPSIEQEVSAEVAFHLEMRAAELVERGLTPDAARAEAQRRFGDTNHWSKAMTAEDQQRAASAARVEWLGDLQQDLRYGVRSALRAPLFSLLAIVTLALGIGANAAVFGVVKSVLLDALPYRDADRVARVYTRFRDGSIERGALAPGNVVDIEQRQRSFAQLAAFMNGPREGVFSSGRAGDQPSVVQVEWVEPEFFRVLGVQPAMGRALRDDDKADTVRMVMLSHRGWQRLLGGDPQVVGREVRVNGITRTVVGVLPRTFVGPAAGTDAEADFYYPLDLRPYLRDPIGARGSSWLGLVGRLKPGVTVDAAQRDMSAIADQLAREYPQHNASVEMRTVSVRDAMVGDTRTPLLVLMASAGLVLLITCANLAGALLSRTISRRKEFAVRTALGAGRARIIRQLLTESVLLSLAGGAAGVLLAVAGLALLRGIAAQALPPYADLSLDPGALVFTSLLALVTGLAFGLAPALSVRRANAQSTLRDETRGTSESARSRRLRGLLVAGQIALCVSLLTGAGLLTRSLLAMTSTPLGFRPEGVLTVAVQLPAAAYRTPESAARFFDQLEERLRGLPGVTAVGDVSALPTNIPQHNGIRVLGAPPPPDDQIPFVLYANASDDYFKTLGIPLRKGRTFGPQDRPESPAVMVVSEAMARKFWPNGNALGGQLRMGPNPNSIPYTVVGIVGDVRNDPARADAEPMAYLSSHVDIRPTRFVVIRTSGDPTALVRPFQRELAALDPGVPSRDAAALTAFLSDRLTARRLPVVLMSAFGALALVLASVGVYAMFAAMTAAREREFGVRVALGSSRGRIAGLVLRQGGIWMALGLAGGTLGVLAISRFLRELLFGVQPFDPVTLVGATLVLLACGAAALLVPVRRATRVDPVEALR
ncbi:ABC transporter permease [Gemmatirosa kalamazoonensis]|uniref:ABC transporter permease n=1 Tax=Gemmatirosa kalamazoonensis TaxID=861299 RepID=UPI00046D0083|nr:ABC transporter permease [Gemmatirosa kalamazoonensis]